jgi:hypothetical protein
MARSDFKTWLSLDEFAQILGFDPLGFNGLASNTIRRNNVCGDVTFQYDYQHSDRLGRETMAIAIQQAEQEISQLAGYNLMPDWTVEERAYYPRPAITELYGIGINSRHQMKSIELEKAHVLYGGIKAKSLITAGASVFRSDSDSDGFQETCTVTIPITITTSDEIHAYYPAKNGSDGWEIRPISVSISGGFATITFKVWQITAANKMDALDPQPLDADDPTSYETTIDVYRVYTDISKQVQFLWEGCETGNCCGSCAACELGAQDGCFHLRDQRLGFVVANPATYDQTSEKFVGNQWSACREPDQIKFWYYSGYRDFSLSRPYAELSNYWKFAVAVFAVSKFERTVCGCSNINQFVEKWRRDAAFASQEEGGFTVTAELAANRLGTSMGALYAYRRIQNMKVNK